MPALHLFKRRTIFAGDDLQPASYLTILIRLFEVSFLLLPIAIHSLREARFFLRLDDDLYDDLDVHESHGSNGRGDGLEEGGARAYLFRGDESVYPSSCSNYGYISPQYYPHYGSHDASSSSSSSSLSPERSEWGGGGETGHIFPFFLTLYTTASILHAFVSIFTERSIALACSVGSPTEPHRRNPRVARLVERRWIYISIVGNAILVFFALIALSYRGSYVRCRNYKMNESGYYNGDEGWSVVERYGWWIAWGIVGIGQATELCFYSMLLALLLNRMVATDNIDANVGYGYGIGGCGGDTGAGYKGEFPVDLSLIASYSYDDDTGTHSSHYQVRRHQLQHELTEKLWSARCRSFCRCAAYSTCFLFGGKAIVDDKVGDYGDVARALADYLEDEGVLDIVPSDIAAGLVLLQRVQSQKILEGRRADREAKRETKMKSSGRRDDGDPTVNFYDPLRGWTVPAVGGDDDGCVPSRKSVPRGSTRTDCSPPKSAMMVRRDNGILSSSTPNRNRNNNNGRGNYHNSLANIIDDIISSTEKPTPDNSSSCSSSCSSSDNCGSDDTTKNNNSTTSLPLSPTPTAPTLPPPRTHTTSIHRLRMTLSPHSPSDQRVLAEGARFARHSLAIYTYMLYVYMYPATGLARLLAYPLTSRCRRCFRRGRSLCCSGRSCSIGSVGGSKEENDLQEPLIRNAPLPSEAVGVSVASDIERGTLLSCCDSCDRGCVDGGGGSSGGLGGGGTVRGDNCWRIHTKALLSQSGLDESDLVYAEFGNRYHHMPYCILVDHKWKSVVVSIRGTLSLEDCVIDTRLEPEPLDDLGREHGFDGDGEFCHKGVVGITKNIMDDLGRHKILSALLLSDEALYPDYTLRITGHSLGGATATLLGFFLRKTYPTLRILAISPPGGLFSWRIANEAKKFVTSYVLNNDLISHCSWGNLERLRDEVLHLIGRIRVPKAIIAGNILKNSIISCSSTDHAVHDDNDDNLDFLIDENAKMLHPVTSSLPPSPFLLQLARTKKIQAARRSLRPTRVIPLYPPGRIVHLVKTGEKQASSCCVNSCTRLYRCLSCGTSNVGYKYTPIWIGNDELGEIVVSPTMVTDHSPNRVCQELEKVAVEYGVNLESGVGDDNHGGSS